MFDYSARGGFIDLRFTAYKLALAYVDNSLEIAYAILVPRPS
jgi:hypothetical protein